ncbi:MAG TPA: HlyD family efflux transporter periplasmic adaptor subunit, partial [Alphaproteobacteria bacterium]|nr:HlyD family efflux transporter periplasmic adaptor subunit [Alphaproteobacteria bacterium]
AVSTVGQVVQPGAVLMDIVPLEDTLLVEARIRPKDVAFLSPGQTATVKLTAYDYSIYGGLKGSIERISADTILDEASGESFYHVVVRTEENTLGSNDNPLPIIPGMVASVDILTGKKTILQYLLKPLTKARDEALRER